MNERLLPELDALYQRYYAGRSNLDLTYGPFAGGDPRDFVPDEMDCTDEEIANWRAACASWEAGNGSASGPSCQTFGDGSVVTGTGFGVGTQLWHLAEVDQ